MPPVRTPAARAGKSERTHEENVERAFIAASRRCDRTLEARVESARRASEIHKARTGRGLKITEKDVQNEEMYEEEDDDLPLQYRHLTAGFQTSSPEFNRRFAAYLTTHVAIRTALEQSIIQSYQQQEHQQAGLTSQPELPKQQYEIFPSPFLAQQAQQAQRVISPPHGSPANRYSPYPTLPRQNPVSPLSQEQRSSHISNLLPQKDIEALNSELPNQRSQIPGLANPTQPFTKTNSGSPPVTSFKDGRIQQPFNLGQNESLQSQFNDSNTLDISSFGLLSTALSAESQAFLGSDFGFASPPNETYNATSNDSLNSYATSNKPHFISNEPIKEGIEKNISGLDVTLLPEISAHESSFMFENSNFFDEVRCSDSADLTPGSIINDESDWNCLINRSDPWPFSE
ncbi:hypothetical protein GcM1_240150 [Golovinomyces cichoracearum]|uniref:Uncharacterized protein n=1 Tax=Golovinomyces cichoracearum TaxID=62708 RepID=A0A420III7_9PEZI|nr:hypothetical protein GcM1_240150 [Golovinomyces cichoracearum]